MITIRNLDFWYRRKEALFRDLNLELQQGHIYGLLGRNGAGKTTLLKILSGLSFPKSGEVGLDHWVPSKRDPFFLQEIFFLPEEIWFPNVRPEGLVRIYGSFYPEFDNKQFEDSLERFEVDRGISLGRLSFGQRKKALLAFALACNTRYLFLDEPTNGLDIPSKAAFRSLLAAACSESRIIILSTHQVRDLQSLIDHVLILSEHRILVNESLDMIASRLSFHHSSLPPDQPGILFTWKTEMGYSYILTNPDCELGTVDIETLFTASLQNQELSAMLSKRVEQRQFQKH
ncbi:MAG TPA: ABC transporter ATP-binding protein [Bacteroidales bacterium]|nr:ABC transporter ATP-binding protein [Bacteroidales bacterium]